MAIPPSISREHILAAIRAIRKSAEPIPKQREATKFDLVFEEDRLPPKYVLSVAAEIATGHELAPGLFSGGEEANNFLRGRGFTVRLKRGDWSRPECYMAVWAYDTMDQDRATNKAALYRAIAEVTGRSPKSVEFKVQNVSHFDPRPREDKPINEAANAQDLLGIVFAEYWRDRPAARREYARHAQELAFSDIDSGQAATTKNAPPLPGDLVIEEGAPGFQASARRARSDQLLQAARRHFREQQPDGQMRCESCGFVAPAGLDREVIHIHHKSPLAESGPDGRATRLADALEKLAPLCPTCHAIAHCESPPMDPTRIKALLLAHRRYDEQPLPANQHD